MKSYVLARGRTAEILPWDDGQIVKLFYAWCSLEWIDREARIAAKIAATGLPTPKCYGRIETEGRQGIVYERLVGPSMLSAMGSAPWRIDRYARDLAKLQLEINRTPSGDLPDLAGHLRQSIMGAKALPDVQKDYACRVLGTLPEGDNLCHLDFHPGQVILTADGPKVIDWLTAFKGDPAADVARTMMLNELGSVEHLGLAVRILATFAKRRFNRQYLAAYAASCQAGLTDRARRWKLPILAARLREEVPGEEERILGMLDEAMKRGNA